MGIEMGWELKAATFIFPGAKLENAKFCLSSSHTRRHVMQHVSHGAARNRTWVNGMCTEWNQIPLVRSRGGKSKGRNRLWIGLNIPFPVWATWDIAEQDPAPSVLWIIQSTARGWYSVSRQAFPTERGLLLLPHHVTKQRGLPTGSFSRGTDIYLRNLVPQREPLAFLVVQVWTS